MPSLKQSFHSDPHSTAHARCNWPGGQWSAQRESLTELEQCSLLDLELWRNHGLAGTEVGRKPDRRVVRLGRGDRALFAKYQKGTRIGEWLRELLLLRAPRSAAAREEQAARRLREVGLATPAVLLFGESTTSLGIERESFLVTRALPGFDSLDGVVPRGDKRASIQAALLDLLRNLDSTRFEIPDLYAKHLFERSCDGRLQLGVVDLPRFETRSRRSRSSRFVRHAGALIATLPWLEVADLLPAWSGPNPERIAQRIADRAGLIRLRKQLPQDYQGRHKYDDGEAVQRYRARKPARHVAEMQLLDQLVPREIDGYVLDSPCGAGRLAPFLRERGAQVLAFDRSAAMARVARAAAGNAARANAEQLPLASNSVAGAVCFRFLHHLPTAEQRQSVLAELTRVSREFVVVSFFHPISTHNFLRQLRRLAGSANDRYCISPAQLSKEAAALGWKLETTAAQSPYRRDLWLARLVPRLSP